MRRFMSLIAVIAILWPAFTRSANAATSIPAFARRWTLDDGDVASGAAQRSWTWGPQVIRSGSEPYAEAPGGQRQVWYFDKTRMELTHPDGNQDSDWYVTTGLLVKEMISGKLQLGDTQVESRPPAALPIIGDMDAAPGTTITYADLRSLATLNGEARVPKATGDAPIIDVARPGGQVTQDSHFASFGVKAASYDDATGHNIAGIFLDAIPSDRLMYLAGHPLTEPYWVREPVGHQEKEALIQAFERRVLTYTPANPEQWKVEWANVGRQYVEWRYGRVDEKEAFVPTPGQDARGAAHDLRELAPAAADIANGRQGSLGVAVYDMDSGASYGFQDTHPFRMYSVAKVPIMLAVLDRSLREQRSLTSGEQNLIGSMIKVSDNNAASALIGSVGGAAAVQRYLQQIGITNTQMNGYAWGFSTTTAQDMAQLMVKLGNCSILEPKACGYALDMMRTVVGSQHWGVSAGVPGDGSVALKNGWYPDNAGWGVNSIGLILSGNKHYSIAVFTNPDSSMASGIDTIQQISSQIYPVMP